jgi:hypothetical protein
MSTLRERVIRLAHRHPELRGDLLPLLGASKQANGKVILQQFGGGRAMAMIGGKDILVDGKTLQFGFKAKAKNGANKVLITLEASDTYTVEFWSVRGMKSRLIKSFDDVYAESLAELFEGETGLYLRL